MARGQRRIAPGAAAAVSICTAALGGCATSHIGSEWPCPASQGTPCTGVSAADPARTPAVGAPAGSRLAGGRLADVGAHDVLRTADGLHTAGAAPSVHAGRPVRHRGRADSGRGESDRGVARCPEGCRPFAWLRRLGASGTDASAESDAGGREAAAVPDTFGTERDANNAVSPSIVSPSAGPADLPPAGVPSAGPAGLRSEEVIGRIWIAPYVDDSGVYHEASWVRAVLEPARWRLP